uniref:ENTH domain-containing protein n=1 Tax=Mesocestoides corti TaxID=53468 RepID=A0A5K3FCW3_MESCO
MPLRRRIKNSVGNYSRGELLVREATSNDPAPPSQDLLIQIADLTKLPSCFSDTVKMIWKRLNDKCKNWRHIYKSFLVIEACLQYGSMAFVKECRSQLPQILTLCDFEYSYDYNVEAGFLVREKAKRVASLLKDDNLLSQERQAARNERSKCTYPYSLSRVRALSLASERGLKSAEYAHRSISVYKPTDEYVARNDIEEQEQIMLAMSLSLQESYPKSATKPEVVERSRQLNNEKNEDLLCLDDTPNKTEDMNSWIDTRAKRLSSVSGSNHMMPLSSLMENGQTYNDKWNPQAVRRTTTTLPAVSNPSVLADLSGLDFGPLSVPPASNGSEIASFGAFEDSSSASTTESSKGAILMPLHKTSADDFFASLGNTSTITATATPKPTSKISSMLDGHKDLVDLDNICSLQTPPPPATSLVGNGMATQDLPKPSLLELAARTEPVFDRRTTATLPPTPVSMPLAYQQQLLPPTNQTRPASYQQPIDYEKQWSPLAANQSAISQSQRSSFPISATVNGMAMSATNPFL